MVKPSSISNDDKKWKAENDLGTMVEYHKIMKDKERYKAAMAMKKEKIAAMEEIGSNIEMKKGGK